jgi:hypothetical protein
MIHVACVATACGESQIATLLSCARCATAPRPAWMRDQCRGPPTALSTGGAAVSIVRTAGLGTSRRSPMALAWRWCCAQTHSRARPKLAPLQPRVASAAERRKAGQLAAKGETAQQLLARFAFGRKRWRCCGCDCRTCASIVLGWFVPYAKTHARTSRLRLCSRTAAAEPHSRGIRSALAVGRSNGNRRVGALRCARAKLRAVRVRRCHVGLPGSSPSSRRAF